MAKRNVKTGVRHFALLLILVAWMVYVVLQVSSLNAKQTEYEQSTEALREQKAAILDELTYYNRLMEYTKSDEYLEQYARDKLGWVKEGEILFSSD